jgi:hypothetical protein
MLDGFWCNLKVKVSFGKVRRLLGLALKGVERLGLLRGED